MAKVAIKKMTYSKMDIDGLLEPLGGMQEFIDKNDKVLLKVNLLAAKEPHKAVTTHPKFVQAVAEVVKECGGRPYIGDSPGGPFNGLWVNRAYMKCGFQELSKRADIPLNREYGHKFVDVPNAYRMKRAKVGKYVLKADKIINLPKLKTHSYQYLTLATKNLYGTLAGMTKQKVHAQNAPRSAFADMLLDLLSVVRPHLNIMDGVVGMEGHGPNSGDPIKMDLALASTDAIALDIAVCRMIDVEPVQVPVYQRAKVRKMWPRKIEYPLLEPKDVMFRKFRLPGTASHLRTGKPASDKNPIITKKCIGCGNCERICPKGAVKVKNEKAKIDYDKCIRCFCCHEICPEGAIKVGNIQ